MRVAIDSELLLNNNVTDTGNVELIKSLYVHDQNIEFFVLGETSLSALNISRKVELDWILQPKRRDYYRDPVDIYITNIDYAPPMKATVVIKKGEYSNKK